tara:strand:- start:2865 stop:3569 length:705 start_codon:yes stop_codon:yes gene_type:complete
MSDGIVVKTDFKGWKKVVKELKKIKGGTYKEILRKECAEILSQTTNRKTTKMAKKPDIVKRKMPVRVYFEGFKGGKEAYTLKEGEGGVTKQTTYYLGHRLPNPVWDFIYSKTYARTKESVPNKGLNKGQFFLMSKKLRLPIPKKGFHGEAQKFVNRRENVISNKVFAKEKGKKDRNYKIELESRLSQVVSFGGGAKNLKNIMRGRVRKFEKALEKGILQDVKKRTRAYPLIFGM